MVSCQTGLNQEEELPLGLFVWAHHHANAGLLLADLWQP